MVDLGSGEAVVLIPGIQGRWEWMKPAVDALAGHARVVSYTLCGDRGSNCRIDAARGFDNYVSQLDAVLDRARLERASLCGISYGGLIAVHFAACRPERVNALVLVSAPGPRWRPDARVMMYLRAPHLLAPLFIARSPRAMTREIAAALPGRRERWAFRGRHLGRVLRAPLSPGRMAQRVRLARDVDFAADCARVQAPTLVITGEETLDRIVPTRSTLDYLACIRGAKGVVFEGTGHLGLVTRPAAFARLVGEFIDRNGHDPDPRTGGRRTES